jgi:hypothetical protein
VPSCGEASLPAIIKISSEEPSISSRQRPGFSPMRIGGIPALPRSWLGPWLCGAVYL